VNKYKLKEEKIDFEVREVPATVRDEQIARLKEIKATRDNAATRNALENLTKAAQSGGNLLEAAIAATRLRATVGEISDALEKVFGRYVATTRCISGAYAAECKPGVVDDFRKRSETFMAKQGRRPRILVTKMGQDGHDRGSKVIATAFADLGFDVDIGPLFQTPAETAAQAVENDVHIVGMSSLAGGHKTLLPMLVEELAKYGREDIMIVAGGVIPPQDYHFLREKGAALIFGPGTVIPVAAMKILKELSVRLGHE
jgi:methylmalonyl-CoA mutase